MFFVNALTLGALAAHASTIDVANTPRPDHTITAIDVNKEAMAARRAKYANATVLDTIYIRNGTLVGNRLGHLNETFAKYNAYHAQKRALAELNGEPREDFHIGVGSFSLDIDALDILAIGAVVAGAACWFNPGCSGAVAAAFSRLTTASVSAGADGVALTVARSGGTGARKRDDKEHEEFGCEYLDASDNYCMNSDVMQQIIAGVGMNDAPDSSGTQGPSGSVWKIVDDNNKDDADMFWHCQQSGGGCNSPEGGPSRGQDVPDGDS